LTLHVDLADHYHHRSSVIHRLDPRVKILLTLLFILSVSLSPSGAWTAFAAYLALMLAAVWAARLDLAFTLRRSYVVLPFALAALAIPFITPGPVLYEVPLLGWEISSLGLIRFLSILMRMWLAVQSVILLMATTRFSDLLWGLLALRLPSQLVGTIGFMYRYLFVLADEALRMMRARAARSPQPAHAPRPPIGWQGRVAGSMVGSLFLRSLERSERVYAAMASRGYDGKVRALASFRMRRLDWVLLLGVFFLLALILYLVI
jgi:cobalt/nickel transport system permease protein